MLALFSCGASHSIANDNWPRLRGGDATGVAADDPRLPEVWSKTENVAWKTAVPGWGWSSPVVWGDKVFLTPDLVHLHRFDEKGLRLA